MDSKLRSNLLRDINTKGDVFDCITGTTVVLSNFDYRCMPKYTTGLCREQPKSQLKMHGLFREKVSIISFNFFMRTCVQCLTNYLKA